MICTSLANESYGITALKLMLLWCPVIVIYWGGANSFTFIFDFLRFRMTPMEIIAKGSKI